MAPSKTTSAEPSPTPGDKDPETGIQRNFWFALNEERPLFDMAGTMCMRADCDENGNLHLEFSDGHSIDVPPHERATAWELYGKHHGYAACLPHGKVRVVRHDVPDDNA